MLARKNAPASLQRRITFPSQNPARDHAMENGTPPTFGRGVVATPGSRNALVRIDNTTFGNPLFDATPVPGGKRSRLSLSPANAVVTTHLSPAGAGSGGLALRKPLYPTPASPRTKFRVGMCELYQKSAEAHIFQALLLMGPLMKLASRLDREELMELIAKKNPVEWGKFVAFFELISKLVNRQEALAGQLVRATLRVPPRGSRRVYRLLRLPPATRTVLFFLTSLTDARPLLPLISP
jgi:hypothetical protein